VEMQPAAMADEPIGLAFSLFDVAEPTLHVATTVRKQVALDAASVRTAELRTCLNPDGELRHELRADIVNRSRLFVGLKLPAGARLWSVIVSGRPAQPVRAAGQTGVVLVPVPKTRPGDGAVQLRMIYATRAERLDSLESLSLHTPMFTNIRVDNFYWTLHVPPSIRAELDPNGPSDLDEVVSADVELDKLEAVVEDIEAVARAKRDGDQTVSETQLRRLQQRYLIQMSRARGAVQRDNSAVDAIAGDRGEKLQQLATSNYALFDDLARRGERTLSRDLGARSVMIDGDPSFELETYGTPAGEFDGLTNYSKFNTYNSGSNQLVGKQAEIELERMQRMLEEVENTRGIANEATTQPGGATATQTLDLAEQRQQMGGSAQADATREAARMQRDLDRYRSNLGRAMEQQSARNLRTAIDLGVTAQEVTFRVDSLGEVAIERERSLIESGADVGDDAPSPVIDLPIPDEYVVLPLFRAEPTEALTVALTLREQPTDDTGAPRHPGRAVLTLLAALLGIAAIAMIGSQRGCRRFGTIGAAILLIVGFVAVVATLLSRSPWPSVFLFVGIGVLILILRRLGVGEPEARPLGARR
jgi:hypothetical protein